MQPWMMALMIPILALTIPIVLILSFHQRKMAELIHRNNAVPSGELDAIRQELRELRLLMNQQTIAIDDLRSRQQLPSAKSDVQERLGSA